MTPPISASRPISTCSHCPRAKLPSHLVDESPSIAIAGAMPRGGAEEAVARHSLRGGSCSSAPDARDAASTLKTPASVLENLATVWLRTCCVSSAMNGRSECRWVNFGVPFKFRASRAVQNEPRAKQPELRAQTLDAKLLRVTDVPQLGTWRQTLIRVSVSCISRAVMSAGPMRQSPVLPICSQRSISEDSHPGAPTRALFPGKVPATTQRQIVQRCRPVSVQHRALVPRRFSSRAPQKLPS